MFRMPTVVVTVFCLALVLSACARRPAPPPPAPQPAPPVILQPGQPQYPVKPSPVLPAWVSRGSGAYQEGEDRFFHGVGMANAASGNRILIRTAADNLARQELGEILRNYLTELSGRRGDADDVGSLEQLIQDGLRKAVVAEHWTDPRNGRMYALCRLELKQFKESFARSSGLDPALRSILLDNADRQHARMAGTR